MTLEATVTLAVLVLTLVSLAADRYPAALVVLGADVLLMLTGVIEVEQALAGFASPAAITVAALFVIARGVSRTGAVRSLVDGLVGRGGGRSGLLRLLGPVAALSSVLGNTAVVAVVAPELRSWAHSRGKSPSSYLMPLSFAAILGGLLTLMGTSTTILVSGLLEDRGMRALDFFEVGRIGLPLALLGVPYLAVVASSVLPDREPPRARGIEIRTGETLLLLGHPDFAERWRDRGDFLLVGARGGVAPASGRQAVTALAIVVAVVVGAATGALPIAVAALSGALATVVLRVLSIAQAGRAVDIDVVLLIAASFGLAAAIQDSGLADLVSRGMTADMGGSGPRGALVALTATTLLLTEFVTNHAAAVILFPVALSVADGFGVDSRPFVMALTIAASSSFLSPLGYQTNTIVYGLGGYRLSDYLRLGGPLTLAVLVAVGLLVPEIWPF